MFFENVYYVGVILFVLGLILGSFYNVVIIRTLKGESVIYPPSKCPKCNNKLKWWHNIPVISYLILKGECYFCKSKIDMQYPIVELLTGFMFFVSYFKFGLTLKTLFCIMCLSLFLILAGMDMKERVISCRMTLVLILLSFAFNHSDIISAISGAVAMFCFTWAIRYLLNTLFKKETIGSGDIYILTALGSFLGEKHLFMGVILTLIFLFIFSFPNFFKNIILNKKYDIIFLWIWFVACYILLFLSKIYVINLSLIFKILIFVNLFVTLIPISKYLFNEIRQVRISDIEPVSPSIFLSVLISLFFI